MAEAYTRWDVTEYLQSVKDIRLYLEGCAEEDPGDGSLIRAALENLAEGRNLHRITRQIVKCGKGL
jgi:DNA-binding phage protein